MDNPKRNAADWISFGIHYGFGVVLGLLTAGAAGGRVHGTFRSLDEPWAQLVVTGAALAGGGVVSLLQDWIWFSRYRRIPPQEPRHSHLSKSISMVSLFIGWPSLMLGLAIRLYSLV